MNKNDRLKLAKAEAMVREAKTIVEAVGHEERLSFPKAGKHPTLREAALDLESARTRIKEAIG